MFGYVKSFILQDDETLQEDEILQEDDTILQDDETMQEAIRTYVEFKINERNSKDENQTRRKLVESSNVIHAKSLLDRNQPDVLSYIDSVLTKPGLKEHQEGRNTRNDLKRSVIIKINNGNNKPAIQEDEILQEDVTLQKDLVSNCDSEFSKDLGQIHAFHLNEDGHMVCNLSDY